MIARLLTERAIVAAGDHFLLIDWQLNIVAAVQLSFRHWSKGIIIENHVTDHKREGKEQ
jgi:hypothetical protein